VTIMQIAGLVAVAVAVLANYGPQLFSGWKFGGGGGAPSQLKSIEIVMSIRDKTVNPEVKAKCQELLRALMA